MFLNRIDAGKQLATLLSDYSDRDDVCVLGLPRGGVPVAYEIAKALKAPLDVFLVRKLGVPWNKELAMGAIALNGITSLNDDVIQLTGVTKNEIDAVIQRETDELNSRNALYRSEREPLDLKDKVIILVDDGVATGSTIKAAISALKEYPYKKIVVAVPVAPPDTLQELKSLVDEVICITAPFQMFAIGNWYEDFSQTSSEEVVRLLNLAR